MTEAHAASHFLSYFLAVAIRHFIFLVDSLFVDSLLLSGMYGWGLINPSHPFSDRGESTKILRLHHPPPNSDKHRKDISEVSTSLLAEHSETGHPGEI
jgi:hypothetical protein